MMDELRQSSGVHWIANEGPGVVSGTEMIEPDDGRFVLALDGVPVALAGPHGQSLTWLTR